MANIDNVGDLELLTTMIGMFGGRRTMELAGWAIRWGLSGDIDNLKEVRERLQAQGLSRSAVYRALADFKLLRERLEASEHRPVTNLELLRRLGASVPHLG